MCESDIGGFVSKVEGFVGNPNRMLVSRRTYYDTIAEIITSLLEFFKNNLGFEILFENKNRTQIKGIILQQIP